MAGEGSRSKSDNGRMMDAAEAERAGLVSRVVPLDTLMDEALAAALMVCSYSQIATMAELA